MVDYKKCWEYVKEHVAESTGYFVSPEEIIRVEEENTEKTDKTPQEQLDEVTGQTPESETPAEPEVAETTETHEPIQDESQSDQA